MMEIILFTVASLPVIFLGKYIYSKDKNKESILLLTKLFFGGIGSCFMVLIVGTILGIIFPILATDRETLNLFELIINVFIGVALIEELCKWIISYSIAYNDSDFEENYDMIVYSAFVALGFAFFENLLYVYDNGITTGVVRALTAVPGHTCDGIFMGYYLGLAKQSSLNNNKELEMKYLILSIIVPTIFHGIYDYCLFANSVVFLIIFVIFVIAVYIFAFKKVKSVSSINRKMKYKDNYCPNCGHIVDGNYCPICGRKNN